jgi:hypothetical protein
MSSRVERDFAALLASGWPTPAQVARPTIGGFTLLLACHEMWMAEQLVNSAVPETRAFWRERYPALATSKDTP